MIISFAFGLIAALLVLANCRHLRNNRIFLAAFILAAGLSAVGYYFISTASKKTDIVMLFPMFTPITALILLFITRMVYKRKMKQDIIIYMYGLFPVRSMERYVTRLEKNITFILLLLSVAIPYMILILFK